MKMLIAISIGFFVVGSGVLIGIILGYLEYRLKSKSVLNELKKQLEKTNSEIIKSKTHDENKNG